MHLLHLYLCLYLSPSVGGLLGVCAARLSRKWRGCSQVLCFVQHTELSLCPSLCLSLSLPRSVALFLSRCLSLSGLPMVISVRAEMTAENTLCLVVISAPICHKVADNVELIQTWAGGEDLRKDRCQPEQAMASACDASLATLLALLTFASVFSSRCISSRLSATASASSSSLFLLLLPSFSSASRCATSSFLLAIFSLLSAAFSTFSALAIAAVLRFSRPVQSSHTLGRAPHPLPRSQCLPAVVNGIDVRLAQRSRI